MQETTQYENNEQFSLRKLMEILFKRRVIILSCVGIALIIGVAASIFMKPVYLASSTLLLEKEAATEKAVLLRVNQPNFDAGFEWIDSEIRIMQSYPVAVASLNALRNDLMFAGDSIAEISATGIRIERDVRKFQDNLKILGGRTGNVVEVAYEHENPDFAVKAVDQIIDVYVQHRARISKESDAYQFFESQLQSAAERLKQLEKRQFDYKEREHLLSPDQQHTILLNQLSDYQKSLTTVRTQRISKEARLKVIKDRLESDDEFNIPTTETSDSPSREKYIAKLKSDLSDLELQLNQTQQRFAFRYSDVVQLEKQIREVKLQIAKETGQIVQSEEMAIKAFLAEENELQSTIDKIRREMQAFSKKEFEYNQISRGINDSEEVYSMLLKQREEARISLAKLEREVKIKKISPALVGKDPVRPRKKLYIALALILGGALGMVLAFGIEFFDHTISSPDDLEKYAGLSSLGAVAEVKVSATIS